MSNRLGLRGAFWPQDAWGRVVNAAVPREAVAGAWIEAADDLLDLAIERFGDGLHSLYLSGAAARGRPDGGVFIVLLRLSVEGAPPQRGRFAWETAAAGALRRRYTRLGSVAVQVYRWKDVFTTDGAFSPARFRLAVNSICLAGRDMNRLLAPQRLDAALMNADIVALRPRLSAAAQKLAAARTAHRVRAAAREAGCAVLAAAHALVLEQEQTYTEDLDLQRDLFVIHHPSRKRAMRDAYVMATQPPGDAATAQGFVEASLRWLGPMTEAWLNAHNPQRLERLKA